jgi:ATP-binding cassette subfamily A (ABC1) protein 3
VGFCPQFDNLFDQFTARETVHIYADIKGIPLVEVDKICNSLFEALKLAPFADKIVRYYIFALFSCIPRNRYLF